MGPLEHGTQRALEAISATNTRLTIILVCVVMGAVVIALFISLMLTRSLDRLADGMDALAMLDFGGGNESSVDSSNMGMIDLRSRYTELSKCEASFMALQR